MPPQYRHSSRVAQSKKNSIINNERLSEWATEYGLHERIQAARSQEALIRNNPDVRASVFKAYVGAYWKQLIFEADRFDEMRGQLPGFYPDPISAIHAWLDPIIEIEIRRIQDEDNDLADRMQRASLSPSGSSPSTPGTQRTGGQNARPTPAAPPPTGGALALLNQTASQQKPPKVLTWNERDEGDAHAKTFIAELEGEFPGKFSMSSVDSFHCPYRIVDGRVIARGAGVSKKAAKNVAASQAIETLGWVSIITIVVIPNA
jgi:Double-stranded RNA binding motif